MTGAVAISYGMFRSSDRSVRQGRYLATAAILSVLLSVAAMQYALVTHDFRLNYVVENNSLETPLLFTVTGMWSALQGSILLWAAILALYLAAVLYWSRHFACSRSLSVALIVILIVFGYFVALMIGPADPFVATHGVIPPDGHGPNPLLQNYPLVAFHPPTLYAGFVGFTVPFAFSTASLITGEDRTFWLLQARKWSIVSWSFLTVGIALGAWWSYQVLGWGGFWAWDPVENSALLPWLTALAYIHSSMAQEQRSVFRAWSHSLIVSTFALTILGTFITRSGVLQSVHAFSSSTLGPLLISFFALVVVCSAVLVGLRIDQVRSNASSGTLFSRERAFMVNNFLFFGLAVVVLLGTVFPLFVQALSSSTVSVGAPYFNTFAGPIGLMILFFMAVAPLIPWAGTSLSLVGERLKVPGGAAVAVLVVAVVFGIHSYELLGTYSLATFALVSALIQGLRYNLVRRSRLSHRILSRHNGAMVAHVGIVVLAVALVSGTSFGHRGSLKLRPGQSTTFYGQTIAFLGTQTVVTPAKTAFEAVLLVNGIGPYHPAISQFGTFDKQPVASPAVNVQFRQDVYLTIESVPTSSKSPMTIGIIIQPLISWIWAGAGLVALGALLAALGSRPILSDSRDASDFENDGRLDSKEVASGEPEEHLDITEHLDPTRSS